MGTKPSWKASVIGAVVMAIAAALLVLGIMRWKGAGSYRHVETKEGGDILVLCGGSMRASLEAAIEVYRKTGRATAPILTTYGGSGELCAQIEKTGRGELYICHDPFMPWADDRGLISDWDTLCRVSMVIVVPKGNPAGITRLSDLGKPGLRLGIGNRTYSTSGQVVKHLIQGKPYEDAFLKNTRVEAHSHQQRCNDVKLGILDASLTWDAVAHLYRDSLDEISIEKELRELDAITSATYKRSDVKNIKVTAGIVAGAEKRKDVRDLYDFLVSDAGRGLFVEHGFSERIEAPTAE